VFKVYIWLILLIEGAALLDKNRYLYVFYNRVNYGDILYAVYAGIQLAFLKQKNSKPIKLHSFFFLIYSLAFWTAASWGIHFILGNEAIENLLGVPLRLIFYATFAFSASQWVRKYGSEVIGIPYCIGIISMLLYNLISSGLTINYVPAEIPENNFSGLLMPVCCAYIGMVFLTKPGLILYALILISYLLTFFVYSLGGYLMALVLLPALWIVSKQVYFKYISKFLILKIALLLLAIVLLKTSFAPNNILLDNKMRIGNKINNLTPMPYDENSGTLKRYGHICSSLIIGIQNPVFGVGELRWEEENAKNETWLGWNYLENDNPHNAFLQLFSMFGLPALILFVLIFITAAKEIYSLNLLQRNQWTILSISIIVMFFLSGNLMGDMFLTHYFYLYGALVIGTKERLNHLKAGISVNKV